MFCANFPYLTSPTRTVFGPMLRGLTTSRRKSRIRNQSGHSQQWPQTSRELSTISNMLAWANEHLGTAVMTHVPVTVQRWLESWWLSSVLRPRQHSISLETAFYRSKYQTNSIKVLKEKATNEKLRKRTKYTYTYTAIHIKGYTYKAQQVP